MASKMAVRGAKAIQRPDLDQALQGALAHMAQINPVGEIVQIGKGLITTPFQDRVYRSVPHILDGAQPKANGCAAIRVIFDREIPIADIHIRRAGCNPHPAAIRHVQGDLGGIVLVDR